MPCKAYSSSPVQRHTPWNKGKLLGAKPPLRSKHVRAIRTRLLLEGRTRDLAMFNLAVWGDYNSTGSRSIRESQDYVRKGGAAAREMLIHAAANEWKVPAAECPASNSVITHRPSGRTTTYGKVADAAAKLEPP